MIFRGPVDRSADRSTAPRFSPTDDQRNTVPLPMNRRLALSAALLAVTAAVAPATSAHAAPSLSPDLEG